MIVMVKIGIIRCQQTEDACPGTSCFKTATEKKGGLTGLGPVEIVGFVSCGGCPGKRAILRAQELKKRGAEYIVLASCILKGAPASISMACPFGAKMKKTIEEKTDLPVIEYTH